MVLGELLNPELGISSRPDITKILSLSLQRHINPYNDTRIYWAREVTFDYATDHAIRVDYMRFKPVNNTVSGIEKAEFDRIVDEKMKALEPYWKECIIITVDSF